MKRTQFANKTIERSQQQEEEKQQAQMPKFKAFKTLFVARSDYGKSYLIADYINKLIRERIIQPKRIILFSKTFKSDPSQQRWIQNCVKAVLKFEEQNCFEKPDFDLVQRVYEANKKIKEEHKKAPQHYLFVLDDQMSENILSNTNKEMVSLFSLCRHYGISFIFSVQAYTNALGTILRNQITNLFAGQLSSQKALDSMLEHFNYGLGHDSKSAMQTIRQWHSDACSANDNHGFLNIDCTQSPWCGCKYQKGLTGIFYDIKKEHGPDSPR